MSSEEYFTLIYIGMIAITWLSSLVVSGIVNKDDMFWWDFNDYFLHVASFIFFSIIWPVYITVLLGIGIIKLTARIFKTK